MSWAVVPSTTLSRQTTCTRRCQGFDAKLSGVEPYKVVDATFGGWHSFRNSANLKPLIGNTASKTSQHCAVSFRVDHLNNRVYNYSVMRRTPAGVENGSGWATKSWLIHSYMTTRHWG